MRRTALKRKESLRDAWLRKVRASAGETARKIVKSGLKRTTLKKIARSRRKKLASYFVVKAEWLRRPENELCAICRARREAGEAILQGKATEVHHVRGRIGRLLCDTRFFIASCRGCRDWPHENPVRARELQLLAPASEFNVYPATGIETDVDSGNGKA